MYLSKIPRLLQLCFPRYEWRVKTQEKQLYLTFDDGPVEGITDFVLETLAKYEAKATFFMLGKQVEKFPHLARKVVAMGHQVGNHSYSHKNGWQTENSLYLEDVRRGQEAISETLCFAPTLFRPPYGKIKTSQAKQLVPPTRIILLDILCGDFDAARSPQKCAKVIEQYATKGSIIVFHDSEKAFQNMKYALPKTLEHFKKEGYTFEML